MISTLGQVMLYVRNQEDAVAFWTEKMEFVVIAKEDNGQGMKWIEVAPKHDAQTSLVLHDRAVVEKMGAGINLETPSLLFFTENIESLYSNVSSKGVVVGELVDMPIGKTFNFSDHEQNYFAVVQKCR